MSTREEGLAALKAGNPESAIRHFQDVVQSTPSDAHSWAGLGIALCQVKRPGDGLKALERATSLAPAQPSFQYNLGRAYEMLERPADALAAYRRTQELDSKHAQSAAAIQRLTAGS